MLPLLSKKFKRLSWFKVHARCVFMHRQMILKGMMVLIVSPLVALSQTEKPISEKDHVLNWFYAYTSMHGELERADSQKIYSEALADDHIFNKVVSILADSVKDDAALHEKSAMRRAVLLLAYSGREDSIPILVSLLNQSDPKVVLTAIEALQVSGNRAAVTPLLKVLKTYETRLPSDLQNLTPQQKSALEVYLMSFGAITRLGTEAGDAGTKLSFDHVRQRYAGHSGEKEMIEMIESIRREFRVAKPMPTPFSSPNK